MMASNKDSSIKESKYKRDLKNHQVPQASGIPSTPCKVMASLNIALLVLLNTKLRPGS